jgi:ParB/RepB/Spo0J family partition protein
MCGDALAGYSKVGDAFEIVCGHRRSEAATIAGLTSVPCFVRAMDDATAAEIALIDNLQRVDVPAIEEAQAFGDLLDRLRSVQAVALKVGKEQSYVAQRLKLRTLTCWSQDALREKLITIDHALLLCRLAEEEQNAALKWTLDHSAGAKKPVDKVISEIVERRRDRKEKLAEDPEEYSYYRHHGFEPQSVVRLKAHIAEDSGTPLDRAPWPLDADYLGDATACSVCEKNTKANAPLFSDLEIGEPTCTDRACFVERAAEFVRIQARTSEGTQAPLRVSWKQTSKPPKMQLGEPCDGPVGLNNFTTVPKPGQVLMAGQWLEAKKKCPHAVQAVTVDWSDCNNRGYMGRGEKLRKPGEILQVCVTPKCKVHPKSYEQQSAESSSQSRVDPKEEKRREEERKHVGEVESAIRGQIFADILARIDVNTAIRLAAHKPWNSAEVRKALVKTFPKIDGSRLEALTLFSCLVRDDCNLNSWRLVGKGGPAEDRKRTWELAKSVGVDPDVIVSNFFHDRGIDPREDRLRVVRPGDKPAKPAAKKGGATSSVDRAIEACEAIRARELKKAPAKKVSKPAAKPAKKSAAKRAAKKGGAK